MSAGMSREEAFAACTADSYVEFYGGRWMVVPFEQVAQPEFFQCIPLPPPYWSTSIMNKDTK